MGRSWSQGGVQKRPCLCAETFGAEICRFRSRRLCDQRSSQGQAHRNIPGPCSRRRAVPLQIKVHTPPDKGKQRIVHALCSLNEATVKSQTTYEDLHQPLSATALCQQQVHRPADRRYFVCTRPDLMPLVTSTQTPPHLRHHYHQVVEFSHAALPLGWTRSPRIWTNVMSVVTVALRRHGMSTLLHVDDLLITCSSFEEASRT
jgi:hypothetical protein